MLSCDDLLYPYTVSIENDLLVLRGLGQRQDNVLEYRIDSLHALTSEVLDLSDQTQSNELWTAWLLLPEVANRRLFFTSHDALSDFLQLIVWAQGFDSRLDQYRVKKTLP